MWKKLKESIDLFQHISQDVELSPTGWGHCPFHDDSTPSFRVYPERNYWRCFGACASDPNKISWGSIIDYEMAKRGISAEEAKRLLAEQYGIPYEPPGGGEEKGPDPEEEREKRRAQIRKVVTDFAHRNLFAPAGRKALEYLMCARGLSEETIRTHMLGHLNSNSLPHLLQESKVTPEELVEAGFAKYGEDGKIKLRFWDHVLFPVLWRGEVVFLVGRVLPGEGKSGKGRPKYLNLEGKANWLYNQEVLLQRGLREIFVVEGPVDCLTLSQAGFPAVGVLGAGGWKEGFSSFFKRIRKVYLLFDPDPAGEAGSERTLLSIGPNAVIVPGEAGEGEGGKDLNDHYYAILTTRCYALGKTPPELLKDEKELEVALTEFRGFVRSLVEKKGKGAVEYVAERVVREKDLYSQISSLMGFLSQADAFTQDEAFLEALKEDLASRPGSKINKSAFTRTVTKVLRKKDGKSPSKEGSNGKKDGGDGSLVDLVLSGEVDEDGEERVFRPSIHYSPGWGGVVIFQRCRVEQEPEDGGEPLVEVKDIPFLVTTDKKMVEFLDPTKVYRELKVVVSRDDVESVFPLDGQVQAWPREMLVKFLRGEEKVDGTFALRTYEGVKGLFLSLVEFPSQLFYDVVSIWCMGTYLYPLFDSYPYLLLTGEKESGKTRTLTILKQLAYNMLLSTSLTSAALFRTLELGCTFGYDEAETLKNLKNDQVSEINAILNAGYKKGLEIIRMEGEAKKTQRTFRVFGPKVISAIRAPLDTLASRCIPITMLRAGQNTAQARRAIRPQDEVWGKARHRQYCFALTAHELVRREYEELMATENFPVYGRALELWAPILSILRTIRRMATEDGLPEVLIERLESVEKDMIDFAREVHGRYSTPEDSVCITFLALKERFEEEGVEILEMTPAEIVNAVQDYLDATDDQDTADLKLTPRWIGEMLRRFGFTDRTRIKEGTRKGRFAYRITRERLEDVLERYSIE
jgi:DNA primase catalytic core